MKIRKIEKSEFLNDLSLFYKELKNVKQTKKNKKYFEIFLDIETFTYNKKQGNKYNAKFYRSKEYSVAFSYFDTTKSELKIITIPTYLSFIRLLENFTYEINIRIIAHNGNRFDFHFLLKVLKENNYTEYNKEIDTQKLNFYQTNVNKDDVRAVETTRIKSKSEIEMTFKINKITIETKDSYPLFMQSLEGAGHRLKTANLLDDKYLKTDGLQYDKFDLNYNIVDKLELERYCYKIFNNLNKRELEYIYNDVIILAMAYENYSILFEGFKNTKRTQSQNIFDAYLQKDTEKWLYKRQFLSYKVKYSQFKINNINLYDYFKKYYNGGLNFYNDKHLNNIIIDDMIHIDINTSYSSRMYSKQFPRNINSFNDKIEEKEILEIRKLSENYLSLYEISHDEFNTLLLTIESQNIRKIFVKYFKRIKETSVFITNIALLRFLDFSNYNDSVEILTQVHFDTCDSPSKSTIKHFYKIKQQSKANVILNFDDPMKITETKIPYKSTFTKEETELSKLNLNGLAGLPALRKTFPIYQIDKYGSLQSNREGYNNTERNILFSTFLLAHAFSYLLEPLTFLTSKEIDNDFMYTDTDSLLIKNKKTINKILENINLDNWSLGGWGVESYPKKLKILNHKKYCYLDIDNNMHVACAGVSKSSLKEMLKNSNNDFDYFIKNYFSENTELNVLKSVINYDETMTLFNQKMLLQKGGVYDTMFYQKTKDLESEIIKQLKLELENSETEPLFIDSVVGTMSPYDLYHKDLESKKCADISELLEIEKAIAEELY